MRFCFFWALFCAFHQMAVAQNPGCDGSRYKSDVFTTVKKTTLKYAPTLDHLGNAMDLQLDLYEPEGDNVSKRPVVILAHGGSFITGDKNDMAPWCRLLAKKGYVAASIQYRIYPLFTLGFPDSIKIFDTAVKAMGDMKAAVRYFRQTAAEGNPHRVDPDHIFIGGYSAGAVTALHTAFIDTGDSIPSFLQTLIRNNGGLEGKSGTTANQTFSSSAKAVLNMSGGLYRREWIDLRNIPLFSIHGTADQTVPYLKGLAANVAYLEGSGLLHPRAETTGLQHRLETVQGGDHTGMYTSATFAPQVANYWNTTTASLEAMVCAATGARDLEDVALAWDIAPNPLTGDRLLVSLPPSVSQADMLLLDAAGRQLKRFEQVGQATFLTMPQLPAGMYWLRLSDRANPQTTFAVKPLVVR